MSRYTAFISYRHLTPDEEVAKKLHSMIESFGIPAPLKRSLGIRKMGRVFRDQEELPLSSSLGDDIHEALENSDWLICICSPRYLSSRWCMEELRYFLSLGRQDRILTVLVEGEPEDAFPEQIRFQTVDGVRVEKEPLAADVRAGSLDAILKKLRREKLRILAPMLGVSYDDLRQRARRRRNRIIATAAAAAFLLLSGFLGYAVMKNREIARKNDEITQERNEALTAESKWLAKSADEALEQGDRMLSLLLSLEALPTDFENPERPVTEEALSSLRNAMLSDTGDSLYRAVTKISIPGLEEYRAQENTLYCFSRKSEGFITAYDLRTGRSADPAYTLEEEPLSFFFSHNLTGFPVYRDNVRGGQAAIRLGTDESGKAVYGEAKDVYDPFSKLVDGYEFGTYLLLQKTGIYTGDHSPVYLSFHSENSAVKGFIENAVKDSNGFIPKDAKPLKDPEKGTRCYVVGGFHIEDGEADDAPAVLLIGVGPGGFVKGPGDILFRYYMDGDLAQKTSAWNNHANDSYSIESLDVSWDSTIIAGYDQYSLYFWNVNNPVMASAFDMSLLEGIGTKIVKAAFSSESRSLIAILASDSSIYLYDCVQEKILRTISPGVYKVMDFQWNADCTKLLLTCADNAARVVSAADGSVLQTLSCDFSLKKAEYGERNYDDNSLDDTYILLSGSDNLQVWKLADPESDSAVLQRINDQEFSGSWFIRSTSTSFGNGSTASSMGVASHVILSPDREKLWIFNNGLHLYDAVTRERILTLFTEYKDLRMTALGDSVFVFPIDDSDGTIHVLDMNTGAERGTIRPTYPHSYLNRAGYGDKAKEYPRDELFCVSDITFSDDSSLLLINTGHGSKSLQPDPSITVVETGSLETAWQLAYPGGNAAPLIFDFTAEWEMEKSFDLRGYFLAGTDSVLCHYAYCTDYIYGKDFLNASGTSFRGEGFRHVFEVRSAKTGALESMYYLPQMTRCCSVSAEHGVFVVQDADYTIHMYRAVSGEELARIDAETEFYDAWFDETGFRIRLHQSSSMYSPAMQKGYRISFDGTVETDISGAQQKPAIWRQLYPGSPYAIYRCEMIRTDTGDAVLSVKDGDIVLYQDVTPAELRELALKVLDGRMLTDTQKEFYFLK